MNRAPNTRATWTERRARETEPKLVVEAAFLDINAVLSALCCGLIVAGVIVFAVML